MFGIDSGVVVRGLAYAFDTSSFSYQEMLSKSWRKG